MSIKDIESIKNYVIKVDNPGGLYRQPVLIEGDIGAVDIVSSEYVSGVTATSYELDGSGATVERASKLNGKEMCELMSQGIKRTMNVLGWCTGMTVPVEDIFNYVGAEYIIEALNDFVKSTFYCKNIGKIKERAIRRGVSELDVLNTLVKRYEKETGILYIDDKSMFGGSKMAMIVRRLWGAGQDISEQLKQRIIDMLIGYGIRGVYVMLVPVSYNNNRFFAKHCDVDNDRVSLIDAITGEEYACNTKWCLINKRRMLDVVYGRDNLEIIGLTRNVCLSHSFVYMRTAWSNIKDDNNDRDKRAECIESEPLPIYPYRGVMNLEANGAYCNDDTVVMINVEADALGETVVHIPEDSFISSVERHVIKFNGISTLNKLRIIIGSNINRLYDIIDSNVSAKELIIDYRGSEWSILDDIVGMYRYYSGGSQSHFGTVNVLVPSPPGEWLGAKNSLIVIDK